MWQNFSSKIYTDRLILVPLNYSHVDGLSIIGAMILKLLK